jgi:hypothetical protein
MAKIMHSWPEMFFRMLATRDDFLEEFLDPHERNVQGWLMPRMPGYSFHLTVLFICATFLLKMPEMSER